MKKLIKLFVCLVLLTLMILVNVGYASTHKWWMIGGKISFGKWTHKVVYEWRADEKDIYLFYGQYSVDYRIAKNLYLGGAFRELIHKRSNYKEHRPMLNLTWKEGIFKNRSRMSFRGREKGKEDVFRFRNKTIIYLAKPFYVAAELFVEEHKKGFYRDRRYMGFDFGIINFFWMWQETLKGKEVEKIKVFGIYGVIRF